MKVRRALQLLAPIVVASLLGPLLVAIALALFGIASDLIGGSLPAAGDTFGMFVFQAIMAYFIGGPIAFLAGLLVSLWMIWRAPNALVVNAAAVLATAAFMGVAASGVLGPVEETNGRSNFLFMLVCAIVAANICWLLMRPFAPRSAAVARS